MEILRIGRLSDNDVVFNENEVSRYHCELYCNNGKIFIKDLDSLNGTQVNGRDIKSPIWLKRQDKVTLGHKVEINWYKLWTQFYSYPNVGDDIPETIRYDGKETVLYGNNNGQQGYSPASKPMVEIPSSIHIKNQQEYAEVLKSGDDFKVPFKRNLGNNIGHHVGNTLGCIISILIVAALLGIIGLIMS